MQGRACRPGPLRLATPASKLAGDPGWERSLRDVWIGFALSLPLVGALLLCLATSRTASAQDRSPAPTGLSAQWQPLGPAQVTTPAYGKITGRVTSISIDPADATGNTVYLGTTGGGVWKSTNAAGPASAVSFVPLTDTLPVFSPNAGTAALPSLSVGAVSAMGPLVLAGTGDPNDATDSFYGEGLLRSQDGGQTWTLIRASTDTPNQDYSFTGLSVAGFAWNTTDPSVTPGTVVAALSQSTRGVLTGAVDPANSVMGLYYSTDAGVTWHMSTLMDGAQIVQRPLATGALRSGGNAVTSVLWNPVRRRFYAAIRYHGYYESPDGITWTRLTHQPGPGLTNTACPANTDAPGSQGCPLFRGALAVEPISGDMYALTVGPGNTDQGLWRDVCAGNASTCGNPISFSQQLAGTSLEGSAGGVIPQGGYNLTLAAVPSASGSDQTTLLFAGTVDLYRCALDASGAGCAAMRNTTNVLNGCATQARVAPAQHALAVRSTSGGPVLLIGNDSGLWRSNDGVDQQATPCSADDASHFENLNSGLGSLAEVETLAQHPSDPSILLAGMGANGTSATTDAQITGLGAWQQIAAGEGGQVAIDPASPDNWYLSTGPGISIAHCSRGPSCTAQDFAGSPAIGPAQTVNDATLIDTPWLLDPAVPANLVAGTCRVWRGPAADGSQWSSANQISRPLAGPQNAACTAQQDGAGGNALIRSLAAGGLVSDSSNPQNAGSETLYAGTAGALAGGANAPGHLFVTQAAQTATGTTAWTDVTGSPVVNGGLITTFNPCQYDLSSIAVDPHDLSGNTVYVTVMGFGVPHVYRSIDAGAHWSNISRNLPDAPANSVVIDPNDANTVYVAMDTGVYATTQVSTCDSANCWSLYGTGLPNAPVTQLLAAGAMPTGDGRTGELRAATYGRGVWQIPLLAAAGSTQAAITVAPTALAFAAQAVGTASAVQTVTVTNTGNAPLTVSRIDISLASLPLGPQAEFSETDTCTGASIATGGTCTLQVSFAPAATGSRSATLTIFGNVVGGQTQIALSGSGLPGGSVVLTPLFLRFPSTEVNATSPAQNITVSNVSGSSVPLGAPSVAGDFRISANTCGTTLASQTGCTLALIFTPTASQTRTGLLSISGDGTLLTASLTGNGVLPATDTLAPASLSFAPQTLGTTSPVQRVTVTNSGDEALTLIAASTTGAFAAVNSCGNSLAGHSSCAIDVLFQPTVLGAATGSLRISDQFRVQTVALSGSGLAPPGVSLSPLFGMAFPATGVGLSSSPQAVTLTNNGQIPLHIATLATKGDFSILANPCGDTLAVASACTLQIVFRPTAGGTRTGALTVNDDAINSPQTLPLTGPAVDFALVLNGPTSVTTSSGQNAVFPLLFTSGPTVQGAQASLTCTGLPSGATCNLNPSTLAIDGNTTPVSVTVLTGQATSHTASKPPATLPSSQILWSLLLLPGGAMLTRRRRLAAASLLCCLIAFTGCVSSRKIPPGSALGTGSTSGSVTPTGTYSVVVTATAAGLSHSVNLTLVVQ
jgi:hypothetical protein